MSSVHGSRRRHPAPTKSRVLALLGTVVLTLAACAGGGTDTEADPQPQDTETGESTAEADDGGDEGEAAGELEVTDITIGILPTPDYAPAVIAVEEGFFEEEGLNAETTVMAPGQAVPGIVSGTYDFGGVNTITFILSVNSGVDLHPVIELDRGVPNYAELLVTEGSEISSLEHLPGKAVAVVATPGNCDVLPLDAMQQQGIEDEPNFVNLSIPDMPGALQRGDVDAACVPQPLLGELLESGDFTSIWDVFEGEYTGFPIVGMSTSQEFADANPNTVAAFSRALERGAEMARDDDTAVREVLPLYTNFTPEQADVVTLPEYPVGLAPEALERTVEVMNRVGIFDDEMQVPDLS